MCIFATPSGAQCSTIRNTDRVDLRSKPGQPEQVMGSRFQVLIKEHWRNYRRFSMGRPLQGSFELRIYDTPELNWANVEDVQLILVITTGPSRSDEALLSTAGQVEFLPCHRARKGAFRMEKKKIGNFFPQTAERRV